MDSQLTQNFSTVSADFPFIYLHNEMVKYFQEKNKNVAKIRQKWMEQLRHSDSHDVFIGPDDCILPNQIFSHVCLTYRNLRMEYFINFFRFENLIISLI
jgi:regulatory protein YycI of two-component signal transduction system YycFG